MAGSFFSCTANWANSSHNHGRINRIQWAVGCKFLHISPWLCQRLYTLYIYCPDIYSMSTLSLALLLSAYSYSQHRSLLQHHLFMLLPPPLPPPTLAFRCCWMFVQMLCIWGRAGGVCELRDSQTLLGLCWEHFEGRATTKPRTTAAIKSQILDVSVLSEIYSSEGLGPPPVLARCQILPVTRHLRPQRCLGKDSEAL